MQVLTYGATRLRSSSYQQQPTFCTWSVNYAPTPRDHVPTEKNLHQFCGDCGLLNLVSGGPCRGAALPALSCARATAVLVLTVRHQSQKP